MNLKPREQILAGAAGLAVFLVVNCFLAGPAMGKWRELGDQDLKLKADFAEAKLLLAREPQLQAEYNHAMTRLRDGTVGQSAGDVIGRIEQLGSQYGVTFTQRTPSEPLERQRYVERQAQFTLNTQWPNMVKFLFALNRQPEVYRVVNLRVRADTKDPHNLHGDMTVVNYYMRGTASAQRAAGAAPQNPVDKPAGNGKDKTPPP